MTNENTTQNPEVNQAEGEEELVDVTEEFLELHKKVKALFARHRPQELHALAKFLHRGYCKFSQNETDFSIKEGLDLLDSLVNAFTEQVLAGTCTFAEAELSVDNLMTQFLLQNCILEALEKNKK
jgi:hypothetical protein